MYILLNKNVKDCPFCGSNKLKLECVTKKQKYKYDHYEVYKVTYSVRCNKCHARGPTSSGDTILNTWFYHFKHHLPDTLVSESDIAEKAIRNWNEVSNNRNTE